MGDFTVPRNATVKLTKVDGQLHLLERARVQAEGESPIEISGEVICEGDAEIEGSLTCSRLNVDHGRVEISGDIKSTGEIDVEHGELRIDGSLDASSVEVDARLFVGKSATAHDFDVGGRFESKGNLTFESIDVGGTVDINGNGEGEEVDIGGMLEVSGNLHLKGDLEIGGKARIGGILKLASLEVGGMIEADLIEAEDEIEVGGRLRTTKGTKAKTIELGHRSEAIGVLVGGRVKIGDNARVEDVYADTVGMGEGVRAANGYAKNARFESRCRISGEVRYSEKVEAESDVEFAKPPTKTDNLPKPPL